MVLEARSLRKAVVPSALIEDPSPGNFQSTRLALHVNEDGSSCLVYIASGCQVYKLQCLCYATSEVVFETHKSGELMWNLIRAIQTVPLSRFVCIRILEQVLSLKRKIGSTCVNLLLRKFDTCPEKNQFLKSGKKSQIVKRREKELPKQVPMDDSSVSEGKESLLIPVQTQVIDSSLVNRCPHRSEIQSIVLSETESPGYLVLGSVDSYGHLIVSKLDISGKVEVPYQSVFLLFSDIDRLTYSVLPRDSGVGEGSWAGLCFSPSQWSMAAVARSFCKSIDVYDQDIHVRTLRTLWYPSSLNFLENLGHGSENSILAVAEGCQLTLWDLRMKENGGCLQRICGSVGDIFYAVCSSSTGHVAVGGADRTVTIYDPRRLVVTVGLLGTMYENIDFIKMAWDFCFLMSKVSFVTCDGDDLDGPQFPDGCIAQNTRNVMAFKTKSWISGCITGLAFSSLDPDYIYVQGVDYEVLCGQWKECNKVFSFRGDSNWLGFSKCSNRDVMGGWCDSGSIFLADVGAKESEINILTDLEN
ncbi:unnamed protein product [Dovyalis caffra]|uniref:Uncharacterized protein n=1 Tax=Dovyalis caffra TaxID=77055 RepID=A0AAV1S962_9ROSI|nr:unnamed protein product [Dovyalis caffra]